MFSNIHVGVDKENRGLRWTPNNVIKCLCMRSQGASFAVCGSGRLTMLSNIHTGLDKEHRLRKWTPNNVIKHSYRPGQGASFAEVDVYQCNQIFI